MREETTKFAVRIHYRGCEVPGVIGQAREMFWEPYRSWKAWLRCGPSPGDPCFLSFRVHGRPVFRGRDRDVVRLLAEFQRFLDEHADHVDRPGFRCVHYPSMRR